MGVSHQSAQATVGKGLAQDSYMAARAGVEPTTLWLKVVSTKAPPRPTIYIGRMVTLQHKEQKISPDVGSIPNTLPEVNSAFPFARCHW